MPRTLAQIAEDRRLHAEMLDALSRGSARDIATLRERLAQKRALLEAEEASGPASRAEDRKRNAALIAMLQGGAETGGGPVAAIRKLQEYNALLDAEEGPRAESAAGAAPAAHIEERRRVMPRNFARERELLNQVIAESAQPRHEIPQRHAAIRAQLAKLEEEEAIAKAQEEVQEQIREVAAARAAGKPRTRTKTTVPEAPLRGQHNDVPVWQAKLFQDFAERAGDLSMERAEHKYPGLTPEEWAIQKKAIEADYYSPPDAYSVEVIPGIDPVALSPREILNVQKNPKLAALLFKDVAGRRPLPGEVQDFIARLKQDYSRERLQSVAVNPEELDTPFLIGDSESLLKRAELPQKIAKAQLMASNLALPNAVHKEADSLIRESAAATQGRTKERQADLRKLKQQDIVPRVESELTRARKDPIKNYKEYYNPYDKEVVQSLREQAAEDWNERIAPSISGAYAVMGNTRSGAHVAALERAKLKQEKALRGELARLKVHGFESAHESAKGQQKAALDIAQVTGNVGKAQQEHMARAAELSMRDAAAAKTQELLDADARSKLAASQMQQEQAVMNERIKAAERPIEDEERGLLFERAMQSGSTFPVMPSKTPQAPPPGINPYTFLSGMAGQLGAMAGFPQQQQMAHGGHAKRKFAGGGLIPSWQELSMQVRPDKYAPQQEKIAEQLQTYNSPFNPMQNWMQHVSAQQLQNLSGDPLAAMGRGAQLAHADQLKYQQHAYDQSRMDKIQAANLYDKMNDSLRHQQHFLADYVAKKAHHLETQRHHGAIEDIGRAKLGTKMQAAAHPPLSVQERRDRKKIINEEKARIRDAIKLKKTLSNLERNYGQLDTGPIRGSLPQWLASLSGMGKLKDIQEAEAAGGDLILGAHQTLKNIPRSDLMVKRIEETKPHLGMVPEAAKQRIKTIREEGPDYALNYARTQLEGEGFAPDEIDAYIERLSQEDSPAPKTERKSHANDLSSIGDEELMRMYQVAQ